MSIKSAIIGLLGCVLLLGCEGQNNGAAGPSSSSITGVDGYKFGTPQFKKTQVVVNVVTYKTYAEFKEAIDKYKIASSTKNHEIKAFTMLNSRDNFDSCTIHIMDPATRYEPEWIGHEFVHCIYGQWHTNNAKRS